MTKLMGIYKGAAAKNGQCVVYMHADQSVLRRPLQYLGSNMKNNIV